MIEVEQKFILSKDDIVRLTEGAEFLGEKIFDDAYFDTKEFALTKNDMWLRCRSGQWDLKIPKNNHNQSTSRQYQEVEGEENIRQIFDVAAKHDFLQDISEFGYAPFCEFKVSRRKFSKDGFSIDLDVVEAQDFFHTVGEIELMVESEDQMQEAIKKIETFANSHGLKSGPICGKAVEYLKRKKPEHYQALVEVGVA